MREHGPIKTAQGKREGFMERQDEIRDGARPAAETARSKSAGMSRRTLCLGIGGAAVALGLGGLTFAPSTPIVRPPGGQDEDLMYAACIRCEKCYEVCPHHVIKPAHIEDGIIGMRMPQMDFDAAYCNFCAEENDSTPLCVQACPTEALKLPEGATAEKTIIGIAEINTDWCLAYHLIGCRFCYDACPYEALELDDINRPVVIGDKCNGCDACEAVCVSLKEGSISVGANARAIVVKPIEA